MAAPKSPGPGFPFVEYIDVLDEKGKPAGRVKTRSEVHRDGDWHATVHVWIVNSRGELLIQKRGPDKHTYPGRWDTSSAGHISAGDSPAPAAVREVREEIGLVFAESDLEPLCTLPEQYHDATKHDNEIVHIYLVRADVQLSDCSLQREEVSDARFISYAELKNRIDHGDPEFVPHQEEYDRLFAFLDTNASRGN